MRNIFLGVFLCLFFESCISERNDTISDSVIVINPFLKEDFEPVIEIKKIVKLESKPDLPLVSPFWTIEFVNDKFYIADAFRGYFYIFNNDGKFLERVGKLGSGPGEFTTIFDLDFDPFDSVFVVFAHNDRKVLRYNLDGKFVNEFYIDFFAKELIPLENGFIFYVDFNSSEINDEKNILLTNTNGKIDHSYLKYIETDRPSIEFSGFLSKNNLGALYATSLEDTIYQITENALYPRYVVDFGSYRVPAKVKSDPALDGLIDYSILNRPGFETDKYLILPFTHKRYKNKLFYNKESGKSSIDREMENPIFQLFSVPSSSGKQGNFISEISFGQWFSLAQSKKDMIAVLYPELYEMLKNFTEEDNSILVIYSIF